MSIFIEEEGGTALPFNAEEIAGNVIEAALEYENCPYEAEISVLLTTDVLREDWTALQMSCLFPCWNMTDRAIFHGWKASRRMLLIRRREN